MTYKEYEQEILEALKKADGQNLRDKNAPAYRILARAAADKSLTLDEWQKLHDLYYQKTRRDG